MRNYLLLFGAFVLILSGCSGSSSSVQTTTPTLAAPAFSPAAGSYTSAQTVTISDASTSASIYYTTDGSTPTAASTKYTGSISIASSATMNAIAIATGYNNSSVATAAYTINLPQVATPTFSPSAGTYSAAQTVTISDATQGATIYYTTDGSTPTTSSSKYAGAVTVSATTTVKAIATATGYSNSTVGSATFTITLPAAAAPTFSPTPGSYTTAQSVTVSDATANATIYYTTDGTTPTASSTQYTAPFSVTSTTTVNAIAVASGYSNSTVASGTYTFPGSASPVSVVLSKIGTALMGAQPNVNFTANSADAGTDTIVVDATQQYQTMDGFGAAFTDSAAYLLNDIAQKSDLTTVMNNLFTRNGSGIGLSFMRIPIGASDLTRSIYSFDDRSSGSTDLTLASFSISHDQNYVLPIIQQAKALNSQMKFVATPWSPPGWMKESGSMLGGQLLMTSANETAYANYFVKYLQAYEAAGLSIDYLTLQNEPLNPSTSMPAMIMQQNDQLTLLRDHVLPAFATNNISTKVMVYDHNWNNWTYPETVLGGLTAQQLSTQVAGTAWHGYDGTPGAQQLVQNLYPSLGTWMTELTGTTGTTDQFGADFREITQVLRNAAKGYVKWSLALDENYGPNVNELGNGMAGCNTCTPLVTVNSQTGAITYGIEYYTLGHFSKYVLPGAVRIYSSNTPHIADVAFRNTDGSIALIAYNSTSSSQTFQVQWGTESFSYTLPTASAATFSWSGNQSGTPLMAATAQIQASSFSSEDGLQTESGGDSTGNYDLGYLTNGAYTLYKNVDFGTSGSIGTVKVRTASAGNGGTAKFYLDDVNSTPIATVTLPVTGGWQTWQTVSASVSNVSGVHNLYVVFSGTSYSLSNVNWFQFAP